MSFFLSVTYGVNLPVERSINSCMPVLVFSTSTLQGLKPLILSSQKLVAWSSSFATFYVLIDENFQTMIF